MGAPHPSLGMFGKNHNLNREPLSQDEWQELYSLLLLTVPNEEYESNRLRLGDDLAFSPRYVLTALQIGATTYLPP